MDYNKKRNLEKKGWKVGTVEEFLGLTTEESTFIEFRLFLSKSMVELRKSKSLTQGDVAKLIGSSQSRVSKMEKCDLNVTIDLMLKSLLATGGSIVYIFESFTKEYKRQSAEKSVFAPLDTGTTKSVYRFNQNNTNSVNMPLDVEGYDSVENYVTA